MQKKRGGGELRGRISLALRAEGRGHVGRDDNVNADVAGRGGDTWTPVSST